MKKVSFICFANVCRSQIAEALLKIHGKGLFDVYSAGINPLGRICQEVINLMHEKGIDISAQYSKGLDEIPLDEMDYVITMGCCSADSICPDTFSGKKIDWNIPDPYGYGRSSVSEVFEIIDNKIKEFLKDNFNTAIDCSD